jgi:hypothetical protein
MVASERRLVRQIGMMGVSWLGGLDLWVIWEVLVGKWFGIPPSRSLPDISLRILGLSSSESYHHTVASSTLGSY